MRRLLVLPQYYSCCFPCTNLVLDHSLFTILTVFFFVYFIIGKLKKPGHQVQLITTQQLKMSQQDWKTLVWRLDKKVNKRVLLQKQGNLQLMQEKRNYPPSQ